MNRIFINKRKNRLHFLLIIIYSLYIKNIISLKSDNGLSLMLCVRLI